jgi:hypothetical protein
MSHATVFPDSEAIASGGRRRTARGSEDRYGPADLAAIRVFENEGGHVVDLDRRAHAFAGEGAGMASHIRALSRPRRT